MPDRRKMQSSCSVVLPNLLSQERLIVTGGGLLASDIRRMTLTAFEVAFAELSHLIHEILAVAA